MLDFADLTTRQREIYNFIHEKIDERGYGPTVREIGESFGIKSPNGVMCHLKALESKGFIDRKKQSARAIQLVGYKPGTTELPLLGSVAAGIPIDAVEQADKLNFSDLFSGDSHFALRVRGQSMIEDHIDDGDYVVIRKQENATNGQRVVAMIDNEVTLKKFYRDNGAVRLEPANGEMEPIYVDPNSDAHILGVLIGVVRQC